MRIDLKEWNELTPDELVEVAMRAADRAVRRHAPRQLRNRGLVEAAERLETLPKIVDRQTALAGGRAASACSKMRDDASSYAASSAAAAAASTTAAARAYASTAVFVATLAAGQPDGPDPDTSRELERKMRETDVTELLSFRRPR